MLEIRHLTKTYRPKKGVPVKALDDVSLTFGERGMVFLLGKSGSGKSTLLNVLGGLDRFDSGEMILKGVSAHAFRQRELDSYRNTYLGFIFQEYNILEEFTVGANVALAIELQGRRATDEQIGEILRQVDLTDCADRKPNELSGGQKQRVAIARALVKDPDIILADEPTGALDSVTGRQVLETLKRLSADKLVLVVSHDRDFAERYADRIVELSDGRVIRDVERAGEDLPAEGLSFDEEGVTVPAGYRLTEEDREAINAYLAERESGAVIQPRGGAKANFVTTDPARHTGETAEPFRLIRSKLPMKKAFAIGASALKYKKARLVFTLILSVIAFTLFGLSDTMGAFDHQRACADSLRDSGIRYAAVIRSDTEEWQSDRVTAGEIAGLRDDTGLNFCGSYSPSWMHNYSLRSQYDETAFLIDDETAGKTGVALTLYAAEINGFTELTEEDRAAYGFTMTAGRLPVSGTDEIAVSRWLYETFRRGGYRAPDDDFDEDGGLLYRSVSAPEDLLGKTIRLGDRTYTVVGVVDTGFDPARYELLTRSTADMSASDMVKSFALMNEYDSETRYGLATNVFVGAGTVAAMEAAAPYYENDAWRELNSADQRVWIGGSRCCSLSQTDTALIEWFGEPKTVLDAGEVLVNVDSGSFYYDGGVDDIDPLDADWQQILSGSFSLSWNGDREDGWRVVGLYHPIGAQADADLVMSDADLTRFGLNSGRTYSFAVAPMPAGRAVDALVSYCYTVRDGVSYPLQNPVCFELDALNEVFKVLSGVFLWMGVFFACFAGLLLAAFIGASVSRKKQEIGILRAIGSRSADVFRIFFSESFLIAAFNAIAASAATALVTLLIDLRVRETGLLVTVLHFGPRQVFLLIAVSMAVAALASFFPVRRIAAKRPIDAINNR